MFTRCWCGSRQYYAVGWALPAFARVRRFIQSRS
jgi:hypothetical protein